MQLAVGRFENGAHVGETVDADACHQLALAHFGRGAESVAETEGGGDGRGIAVDNEGDRLGGVGDIRR